ncbi:MAG: MBOAT family protein [Defluviitaleaceae bacterium]|nr:MBOAT family protein [Defluviitaleaceae bacterium]
MVFSSMTFLVLFLPIFMAVYFAVPAKYLNVRNFVLLISSLIFYAAGEPVWVVLIIFSSAVDCLLGILIEKHRGKRIATVMLVISLCASLGLLVLFKYSEFLLGIIGINITFAPALPIGISFYTFQTMSYIIDVYRGRVAAQKSPLKFLTYVSMFPQLVAGPIIAYIDVQHMLSKRESTLAGVSQGVTRFVMGLGKKVIFANHAGAIATQLLDTSAATSSTVGVWLGITMFFFQIYFDFSGYSDMAIGLGKIVGFDFKENFHYPYESKSITDFWRRWHISLGMFFRNYVYIPLGGNRKRQLLNIMIIWALTGLWHGASFNFILWGLYFGVILVIEKYYLKGILTRIHAAFAHVYVLFVVMFGWLIFYFTDLGQFLAMTGHFFGLGGQITDHLAIELFLANLWVLPIFAIFSTQIPIKVFNYLKGEMPVSEPVLNFTILAFSFMLLIGQSFTTFIYFRF